jgi:DNA-binding response OmpR family regulator
LSKSILLIDEDPEVLAFLTLLLEERGVRVLRARSRAEALDIFSRDYVPVDLVLANMMMPHMIGGGFEREMARIRACVSVLYMTAFVEEGVIRVEAMRHPDLSGHSAADDRGFIEAVMAALNRSQVRATGAGRPGH